MSKQDFLIGEIVGFHGLRGEVKLKLATSDIETLQNIKSCTICLSGNKKLDVSIRSFRAQGKAIVASFVEYPDRTSAEKLLGGQIFVDRSELAELDENEWWENDLVGLKVLTEQDKLIGVVSGIIPGPSTTIEVIPDGYEGDKRILIPFVNSLVPVVDIKQKKIVVVDLPGLFEPQ